MREDERQQKADEMSRVVNQGGRAVNRQPTTLQEDDAGDESFTIAQAYPRLADLFDDDPNEIYPLPFDDPDDLMMIFSDLEEKNLSLIQQAQDQDQILERTRKEFSKVKGDISLEISNLQMSEKEVKERTAKTQGEKTSLEN